MSDQTVSPASKPGEVSGNLINRILAATEIDTRMFGMIGALLLVWIVFNILSGGLFLTPRNLWNLSVQAAAVSVMATGMVLVIVTRNIDLSVGSVVGFVGMVMATLQAEILPQYVGFDFWGTWIITLAVGIALGAAIGAIHGYIIAFLRVPAFIVTLGGYLVWRGAAWWVTSGRTVAPLDTTFQLMGGGPAGSIGFLASWIVGAVACVAIVWAIIDNRRQRHRYSFPQRPMWAEFTIGAVGCAVALAAIGVFNAYPWPRRIAEQYAAAHNITVPPEGLFISTGIAIPVLMAIGVAVAMNFLARRTRFGRYVFAMGGNPEAADLAGINTRWVTMKIFILMGVLCAISAAIASARLNAATNALGTLNELYVIAAAVIGGTSFAGGIGTIAGAMVGAVVMQSLQSGMVLIGIESPMQSIVIGTVLVLAVWLDTLYRGRAE
ncbi:MAG: sugar ABC transporter permease [Hyphomicrobiaceae bacterium]|nr:sugar ABC transporter permease [Hyphomicrobiaceae bacterium]